MFTDIIPEVCYIKILQNCIFENAVGYERARIPGIICLDSGTIIGYCELRRSDSDWAVIDIGMKKSTDSGKSWSDRKILVSGECENTVNNPLMIADGNTVHFLYCLNYHRVFYMKSTDEGNTWTEPAEITGMIKEQTKDFFWSCIATGPTHGICLSSERLLVPIWLAYNKDDDKSHHPSVISTLFSDDKGLTWKVGKLFFALNDPSEFCIAEINDGEVIANIRHENEEKCRAVGRITSDAEIVGVHFDERLPDPVCCAGLYTDGKNMFFSNCANTANRRDLTLRKFTHDGLLSESLYLSDMAGYSDITVSADKNYAFILYEYEKNLKLCRVQVNNSLQE